MYHKSELLKDQILELYAAGHSITSIQQQLIMNRRYIREALKRWGVYQLPSWGGAPKPPEPRVLAHHPRSTPERPLDDLVHHTPAPKEAPPPVDPIGYKPDPTGKRYVITSALNNCAVNTKFFDSIQTYCRINNAQLLVIPCRYKNVSLFEKDYQVEWPQALAPYYITTDVELNSNIIIMGSMRIQATASRPLQGTVGISKGKSAIFGHPRLALQTVPTPLLKHPLVYMTSGTISEPSYSETKAGRLGEFHHTIGAAIIETDGEYFWWRHIHPDENGNFIDLDKMYYPNGSFAAPEAEAIVVGDVHVGMEDKAVVEAVMGQLASSLAVKNIVLHDVLDFFSDSHHHGKSNVLRVLKSARGRDSVYSELVGVADWLAKYMHEPTQYWMVSSNHHDHLTQWLNNNSAQLESKNLWLWHHLNAKQLKQALALAEADPDGKEWFITSPFEMALRDLIDDPKTRHLHFPDDRKPLEFKGIDCSNHGHRGPNGARGSARGFANTQRKTFIGHTHQPAIVDGCYQVGMSCRPDLPYTGGYSSWLPTSGVIYADGTRTLLPIINGKYRLEE